jgi:hypothetical protein
VYNAQSCIYLKMREIRFFISQLYPKIKIKEKPSIHAQPTRYLVGLTFLHTKIHGVTEYEAFYICHVHNGSLSS